LLFAVDDITLDAADVIDTPVFRFRYFDALMLDGYLLRYAAR